MGTRNARLLASSALALALACSDTVPVTPPVKDRFFYPTGLAIRHAPTGCVGGAAGCQTQLIVVSSNFDLRFDAATGGTVIAVDVDQAVAAPLAPLQAPALLGLAQIGSFGGELAILDESTCPDWETTLGQAPQALVASRSQNTLYRLSIGAQGQLTCGEGCSVGLEGTFGDPYGVTVACGSSFGQFAFVTYLRTPSSEGQLSRIDLAAVDTTTTPPRQTSPRTQIDVGPSAPAHGTVFDASSARLFVTQRFAQSGFSPLRWFSLVNSETPVTLNIYSLVRGAELRGMALSSDSPPSRAYLALRIFDADTAAATGLRPIGDVAGALVVMDLTPGPDGQPSGKFLNVVPIDRGASEIRIVPRIDPVTLQQRVDSAGNRLRDLVAVTCTDDNTLALYDDETGSVANVFDICGGAPGQTEPIPCGSGDPLTGKQPFGLAVEPIQNEDGTARAARLYVGSFDRSWVNVITIDPLNPVNQPASWVRIGPERP